MKIEKYNQKILAIIGTLIIVAVAVIIIIGLSVIIYDSIDSAPGLDTRLRTEIPIDEDTTVIIRDQNITFEQPIQVDTSRAIFIIPVDQINLDNPERISRSEKGLLNFSSKGYFYESHYGLYNNFVLINKEKNITEKIFGKKMAISEWTYVKINETSVLLFLAADFDSNNDKVLDSYDFKKLFAYYLEDGKLEKYEFENQTVLRLEPLDKTEMVSIMTGVDKNSDKEFDYSSEPTNIYYLNINNRKSGELVPEIIKQQLQEIIDN